MTQFVFDQIPSGRLEPILATDTVLFHGGPASAATVTFALVLGDMSAINVSFGGHTVQFNGAVIDAAANGNLIFDDGSHLFIGGPGSDAFAGGPAGDGMFGGDGDDTLAGGSGADTFRFLTHGALVPNLVDVPEILDWSSEDHLSLHGLGTAATFGSSTASNYAGAVLFARTVLGNGGILYVAVQVGPDVFVFNTAGGSAVDAVDLVGRSLNDISGHNFI